ncbi:nucleotidyltransferase domain-containing protein [Halobacillus mangrovi]|uniref:nucleotidyltransferase domain-containing protein n=1 Tax=Halobacillus mangrovi TaxID=402384 RepID=UPI003D97B757
MKKELMDKARQFVSTHYPDCSIALLSGSVVSGRATPASDLDIIIIDKSSFRKSYLFHGVPVEAFVHNDESLDLQFFIEQQEGTPLITRMCAEGVVLKGGTEAEDLVEKGKVRLAEGPSAFPAHKMDEYRYILSDLLDDLEGSQVWQEDIYTVSALIESFHQFILRANKMWTGEGKWMYRSLKEFDEVIAERLTHCAQYFYNENEKSELIKFIDEMLAPFGGRLFHNYYQ